MALGVWWRSNRMSRLSSRLRAKANQALRELARIKRRIDESVVESARGGLAQQLRFGLLDGGERYQDLVDSTHFEQGVQALGGACQGIFVLLALGGGVQEHDGAEGGRVHERHGGEIDDDQRVVEAAHDGLEFEDAGEREGAGETKQADAGAGAGERFDFQVHVEECNAAGRSWAGTVKSR